MFQNTEIDRSSVAQVCLNQNSSFKDKRKWSIKFGFTGIKPKAVYDSLRPLIAQKLKVQ